MILFLQLILALICFIFSVYSCFASDKARSFLFSVFTSVLMAILVWIQGNLTQIMFMIFPLFLLADALYYAFTTALPQASEGYEKNAKSLLYITTVFGAAFIVAFSMLYKFLVNEDGLESVEQASHVVKFNLLGDILWGDAFFVCLLVSVIILIVAVGSVLMVRVKE